MGNDTPRLRAFPYTPSVAKVRHIYICRACGVTQSRWMGKCPDCGQWDTLEEEVFDASAKKDPQKGMAAAFASLAESDGETDPLIGAPAEAKPINAVDEADAPGERLSTGIDEFDRVLGGSHGRLGLVQGSAVLIGGEPGIGKSTLLLQAAAAWARRGTRTLYVTSEESAAQVRMRAERLGAKEPGGKDSQLYVLADTNLARILEQTRRVMPKVLVIDSVQMVYKADLDASPGSITQLRRCCSELVYLAKLTGIAVVLVGHVTKEGTLAGPRLLEHLVDTVVYFEGDRYHAHRVVRAIKNRFGTTLEIGLFEMTGEGLKPAADGSALPALSPGRPGAVACPTISGTRCYMVEVQALTATGFLGAAKRKTSGLDPNRVAMLIAVLEQHAGLRLADRDIFASAVGGVRVVEPAADLAVLLAIAGAQLRRPLHGATAVIGEVGLGGEVRAVSQLDARILEASKLGFSKLILPKAGHSASKPRAAAGLEMITVGAIADAMEWLEVGTPAPRAGAGKQ